ncbi:MAG TPA: DEAD/DEAH box helicase [Nitrososphaeraceae archaeon]
MVIKLDDEQWRVLNSRAYSKDITALQGPPGCGKTTVGSALAVKLVAEGLAKNVLLVAYTNAAANEFALELSNILQNTAEKLCVRTGNASAVDQSSLPIPFSLNADELRKKRIIITTSLSAKKLLTVIRFDNMIVDEAGIEKLEDLLWPLLLGINQTTGPITYDYNTANRIKDLIGLISQCGVTATVVGDPKQSKPITTNQYVPSAIEWLQKRVPYDILRITHRLPDTLAALVNEFACYDRLRSAPEIASRRLRLDHPPDMEYREIITPEEVTTWVDINGNEESIRESSYYNDTEARACARIYDHLRKCTRKSIVIVSRFTGQRAVIRNYLQRMGHTDVKVTTTTSALGTQADIVLFSLVRNNPERIVGQAGTLQDLNVAISRSKEKLIILGSFDMMLNGWTIAPSTTRNGGYKSPSRRLARLIDSKYGEVVDAPSILMQ